MSERRLTAVVVDDEAPARALVAEYLEERADVELVASCANGLEAVKAVTEHRPDLLFLDIQMPKLDGFEVLELLDPEPEVIFTTAFDQHAVRAFEVAAVDYLLKPFSAERLGEAVERARARLESGSDQPLAELARARREGGFVERVLARDGSAVHVISVDRLDWVEARGDQVVLHADDLAVSKSITLTELAEQLDPARFVRVHRSHLLNVERIERIELYAKDSRIALLSDGTKLPVSRSGYAVLRELL